MAGNCMMTLVELRKREKKSVFLSFIFSGPRERPQKGVYITCIGICEQLIGLARGF